MAMIKCPECEKSVSEYAQFCPECGFPISAVYGKSQAKIPVQATDNIATKASRSYKYSRKRPFSVMPIVLLGAFLLICALVFSFFRLSSNNTNAQSKSDYIKPTEFVKSTEKVKPTESTKPVASQQERITSVAQLTDSQLICDVNGIKIWAMNMILDKSYGNDNPYWVLTCYMENKSGHTLHTQFNNVGVNGGFGIDLRGINNEGSLRDGQKGIFHMHVAAEDLTPYGIEKIESLSGVVWIIDNETWDQVVDDEPFSVMIDDIGNAYSLTVVSQKEDSQKSERITENANKREIYRKCVECEKSASRSYVNPFSKTTEYYCDVHYKEIVAILGEMEADVGKSAQSKHTCEQCSREGTHKYDSFTGQTEYYCTEHYEELKQMLEAFGLE